MIDEKEVAYLFIEIRDNSCFIKILNAWSRYLVGSNITSVELCMNKPKVQRELNSEIEKALVLYGMKPGKTLEKDEINWYLFRRIAPCMQKVLDAIIYTFSSKRIYDAIMSCFVSHYDDNSTISWFKMKRVNGHFKSLDDMVDGLNFHELLVFKEKESSLSQHSNRCLNEKYWF